MPKSKQKADIRKDSYKGKPLGVRKSAKGTSNSQPKMQKSKTLEKRTPPLTPTLNRKSPRLEKHNSPNPVRRSDRSKKLFPSGSSISAGGPSDPIESKKKKGKKLVDVTVESEEGEPHAEVVGKKRKIKNAQSFLALFKRQRIKIVLDGDEGTDERDKLSDVSSDSRGSIDCEQLGNGEDIRDGCSGRMVGDLRDGSVSFDTGEKCVSLKDSTASPSHRHENCYVMEICVLCFKNKRVDYNSPEQELCSCNLTDEDLGCFSTGKGKSANKAAGASETAEKCDSRHSLTETPACSQMDGHENVCGLCNKSDKLLCCQGRGCKRFYHLSCLDPRLPDALPGVWHCPQCVKKKLLFGVHSVSEGVESICDVREVKIPNVKGVRQRQFLVKYRGLAHIHNHWVPEKRLLLEDSGLVSSFIENDQILRWSADWTVPHRLLRRRSIEDKIYIASPSVIYVCNYEWLVKWHGLGYDHATWELDDAWCLTSPQGQNLMKACENRSHRAKEGANQDHKGEDIVKLLELPASQSIVNDEYVLEHVTKLRACLFKCQNAVVFYDREQAKTIISFLQSMTEIYRPVLIVTSSSSLSKWEAEFARLAPSVDVVVYSGNKDNRKAIRASEFYEGDHLMLQVLISSAEATFEDLNIFSSIKWKAIVIDDYQQLGMSNDLEQIKMLPVDSRILLISGQIKDTPSEHLAVLSLLESPSVLDQLRNLKSETNDKLCRLKDRLSCFIAYGNNSHVSKFSEYWVPVEISYLQLEQYCATLLSNSVLRSSLTKDNVGALRDIVTVARKCCDHPYLLDSSIQGRLIADKRPAAEILDIGIKACGKLELLDMMLSEIKTRGLQVLVLFQQSISGSGVISTLSLLETFLEQRFGPDSYECVDAKLVIPSEKQAAVSRFNKKENGQFIFLLDKRACTSSIKLSPLDVVIIYDSEWNPANDMRALQKLSISSKVDQIKVFRLYSSFTVEEGALVLAKQNLNLDNSLQNISRTTSDIVLSWGAVNLFSKLDKYHADQKSTSALNFSSGQLLLSKVTKELQSILSENCENADLDSVIVKATLGAGSYSTKVPLLGEEKLQLKDREEPHVFWRNLLDEKKYIWKHRRDGPSPRNRKRTNYFVESSNKPATERDDGVKKQQKVADDKVGPALALGAVSKKVPSTVKACNQSQNLQKDGNTAKSNPNGMTGENPFGAGVSKGMSEGKVVSSDERRTLHSSLQKEMARLCLVLKFPDAVTDEALRFLEYVIRTRDINSQSQPIVQALQISLCWIAASITKTKINRKDSLLLAKQLLNYQCTEDQAHEIYLILKEMYSQGPEKNMDSGRYCSLAEEGTPKEKAVAGDTDNEIKKLNKKFRKRKRRLEQKHQELLQGFQCNYEKEMAELLNDHKVKLTFIRSVHGHSSVGMDKIKVLNDDLARKISDLNIRKEVELKKLEAARSADIAEEETKKAQWMAEAKSYSSKPEVVLGLESLEEQVDEGPQPSDTRVENLVTVNSQNEAGVLSWAMTESVNQSKDSSYNDEAILVNPPVPDEVERNAAEKVSDKGCKSTSLDVAVTNGGSQSAIQPSVHFERTCDLSPQKVQDKADPSLAPVELQGLDEPAVEKLSTLQTEAEAINVAIPVPSNREAPVADANVTPVPSINGTPVTDKTVSVNTKDLSHESTPRSGENLNVHSDHPNNTGPVSSAAHAQSVGLSVPSQNDLLLSHQPTSGIFHQSMSADPLQNELDDLSREAEQLDNNQKDIKSQLSHDRDKDIQEAIAQIHKKYELKFQECDAEYQSKKQELEKNQEKIFTNQMLAAVIRYKCSAQVRQLVARPSSLQHIHHLSTQPSVGPITVPPQQTMQQRAHLAPRSSTLINPTISTVRSPTIINPSISTVRSPTIINQNVPSTQNNELFLRGPPHIGTITPNRNLRSGEIRSAAPHLQSFRSAASASQIRAKRALPIQVSPMLPSTNSTNSQNRAGDCPVVSAAEDRSAVDLPEIRSMFGSLELSDLETIAGNKHASDAV